MKLFSALAILGSLLVSLVLVEVGLRVYYRLAPPADLHLYSVDDAWLHFFSPPPADGKPGIFYRSRPNASQRFVRPEFRTTISTNGEGFREKGELPTGALDIAIVGDSFAFGWGVNHGERFSDRLRSHFPGQQIASLAYPNGHSPPYYDYYLRNHPQYLPRLLIIELFAFNDLSSDQLDTIYLHDADGNWVGLDSETLTVGEDGFIVARTNPVIPRLDGWRGWLTATQAGRTLYRGLTRPEPTPATSMSASKPSQMSALDKGELDETAKKALEHVIALANLVRENGGEVAVMYVPFANRVGDYPAICQYAQPTCDNQRQVPDLLVDSVAEFLAPHQIVVIDPVANFRELERDGIRLYLDTDAHWSVAGHEAAAAVIAQSVHEHGLLGSAP